MSVLLGYGNGSFSDQVAYSTGANPSSVAVGDFNNDTQLDIAVTNSGSSDVSILLGYSNEVLVSQTMLNTGNNSRPGALVIGDFNNDDRMDIGVANSGTNSIGIFLGLGDFTFANPITYATGYSPWSLAAGDLNNDTRLDIVVVNTENDEVSILLGYGNGSFANQIRYSTGSLSSPRSVAVGDFDNDNILDIVIVNYGTNELIVLRGHGNDTFAIVTFFSMNYGSHPFSVVVGDFNNDTKLDLAVANGGTDSLSILLQTC
ncbi:unnamed protein product [Rotaria sp. Silwood2]|nr:unnamed protein product [Rotaria sp. Silwood2]